MRPTLFPYVLLIFSFNTSLGLSTSNHGNGDQLLGTNFKSPSKSPGDSNAELDVWIYKGLTPALYRLFTTVEVDISFKDDVNEALTEKEYEIYQSTNRSAILQEHNENRKFFGWFRRIAVWKSRQVPPFKKSYIGIETTENYQIRVKVTNVNYYYCGLFAVGILLFVYAKNLARNAIFYYTTGTGVGFLASALILVYVLHKFLPKKSVAYSVLIGGWSFSFYLLFTLYRNLYNVLIEYQKWVAVYVVTVVLASFAVCYRLGPPKDPRSLNLSQWALMTLGAILIMAASQVVEIGMAVIAILVVTRNIPAWLTKRLEKFWYKMRPPKHKFMTEEEYLMQGTVETQKALDELREYCRSPKCEAWKMMGKMSSPRRFASFVEGNSHLSDDEMLQYDLDMSFEPQRTSLRRFEAEEDSDSDFGDELPGVSSMPSCSSVSSSRSYASDSRPRYSELNDDALVPRSSESFGSRTSLGTPKVMKLKQKAKSNNSPRSADRDLIARRAMKNRANLNRTMGSRTVAISRAVSKVQKANKSFSNGSASYTRDSFAEGLGSKMPDPEELTSDED